MTSLFSASPSSGSHARAETRCSASIRSRSNFGVISMRPIVNVQRASVISSSLSRNSWIYPLCCVAMKAFTWPEPRTSRTRTSKSALLSRSIASRPSKKKYMKSVDWLIFSYKNPRSKPASFNTSSL